MAELRIDWAVTGSIVSGESSFLAIEGSMMVPYGAARSAAQSHRHQKMCSAGQAVVKTIAMRQGSYFDVVMVLPVHQIMELAGCFRSADSSD
jgi:hypothetical protein